GTFSAAYNVFLVLLVPPDMFRRAVFPVFARLQTDRMDELRVAYQQSVRILTGLAVPLAVGTMLLAEQIVEFLYGSKFAEAVTPLRLLALSAGVTASYASGAVLAATHRQRLFAASSSVELAGMLIMSLALIPSWGAIGAAVAYTAPRLSAFVYYTVVCH